MGLREFFEKRLAGLKSSPLIIIDPELGVPVGYGVNPPRNASGYREVETPEEILERRENVQRMLDKYRE